MKRYHRYPGETPRWAYVALAVALVLVVLLVAAGR